MPATRDQRADSPRKGTLMTGKTSWQTDAAIIATRGLANIVGMAVSAKLHEIGCKNKRSRAHGRSANTGRADSILTPWENLHKNIDRTWGGGHLRGSGACGVHAGHVSAEFQFSFSNGVDAMKLTRLSLLLGGFVFCASLGVLLNEALAVQTLICDKTDPTSQCPSCADSVNGGNCTSVGAPLYSCVDCPPPPCECSLAKCNGFNFDHNCSCTCQHAHRPARANDDVHLERTAFARFRS